MSTLFIVKNINVHLIKQKNKNMKEFNLSDLEWDFSDNESVSLEIGKYVLNISREELNSFIESWDENNED
jgi:hypothetical protein